MKRNIVNKNQQISILYDYQAFVLQKYGGISQYFFELIKNIKQSKHAAAYLSLIYSLNSYISKNNLSVFFKVFFSFSFLNKGKFINAINKPKAIKCLKQQNFDIFHPTYYDPYFLNYLKEKPFVLTVYDMIHEKFPKMFPNNDPTIKYKKQLIEKASRIVAISEYTKKDIVQIYNINPNKIDVIYLASSLSISYDFKIDLPKKYILFVGDRHSYKNFTFFVESVSSLLNKDKDMCLVCAGSKDFTEDEKSIFKNLGLNNKILHYDIKDNKELSYFYKNAQVFVFPSLYEGFGIPVLEAFSCGCPALLSDRTSLPEVGGNAAVYFNPTSKESILNTIEDVVYNKDLRRNLIEEGFKRLENFSWKNTAEQTLDTYKKVLNNE